MAARLLRLHKASKSSGSGRRPARFVLYVSLCAQRSEMAIWNHHGVASRGPGALCLPFILHPQTLYGHLFLSCQEEGTGRLVSDLLVRNSDEGNTRVCPAGSLTSRLQPSALGCLPTSAVLASIFILLEKEKLNPGRGGIGTLIGVFPVITGDQAPAVGFHPFLSSSCHPGPCSCNGAT